MEKNEQKRAKKYKKRATDKNKYVCENCYYITSRHSNYLRHIETKKHLENQEKVLKSVKSVKSVKKTPKPTFKFYCEYCDYKASQKSHYEKHLKTKKHIKKTSNIGRKSVKIKKKMEVNTEKKSVSHQLLKEEYEINLLKDQISKIIESQNEIKKETNTIKKMKNKQNIIYNNNISINVFLDNYCSNAQPIQDFINNISFKLCDIVNNNELIENFISKKVLQGLEDLPVTERPIHCTDQKKKNFIVKDERDGWVKDIAMDNNSKLYTKVDQLHKKAYIDFYKEYDKENPLPHDGDKEQLKFNISSQIINQKEDTNKVIIKDIAKTVDIYDALDGMDNKMIENEVDID
jgi:DNA-directed RNA polymerase subunit M/transcription elongation factor TFIIS